MKNSILVNEEDIRGKILIPYLDDLGLSPDEIVFERSFSIRLGRQSHRIGGRADILCRINGRNIFVIEVKREGVPITQDEVDQGISYARLLDNIAPFTLITNGVSTQVYDTITKNRLNGTAISDQSQFWKNACTLGTEEDLMIRHAALKKFVSHSSDNLIVFCKGQIQTRMAAMLGDATDLRAKYVPDLHLRRLMLHEEFELFLASSCKVFCIIGDAGVGKTSSMCELSLSYVDTQFPIFYNCSLLSGTLIDCIAKDLDIFFSSVVTTTKVLSKLNDISAITDRQTLIFVDGLDESSDVHLVQYISELAYSISSFDRIKLIVSCKLNVWKYFLNHKGTKTYLQIEAGKYVYTTSLLADHIGFHLKYFSDEEFSLIIPKYRTQFGFTGELVPALQDKLANGFFLRIFSETYSLRSIPSEIYEIPLLQKYLYSVLEKIGTSKELALRILARIGKVLVAREIEMYRVYDEGVDLIELIEGIDIPTVATIPEDLFTVNILSKHNSTEAQCVSFYYSVIRDYVICFISYRLDKLDDLGFEAVLDNFYVNYIGQSAIEFYIRHASHRHIEVIRTFKQRKLSLYASQYEAFINGHFPSIKDSLNPFTKSRIGIIVPNDLIRDDGYALVPLRSDANSNLLHAKLNFSMQDRLDEVFNLGAKFISSSNTDLLRPNINKILERNVFEEVDKAVEGGNLNEDRNDTLLLEKLACILYHNHKQLEYSYTLKDSYAPRFGAIYPIDLTDLQSRLLLFRAKRQHRGRGLSNVEVTAKAEQDVLGKLHIPAFNTIGDFPPYEELERVVESLMRKGYTVITSHYLPTPDLPIPQRNGQDRRTIPHYINEQYSDEVATQYIQQFVKLLFQAYKDTLDESFPTLKSAFRSYGKAPQHHYFYGFTRDGLRRWWYGSKNDPYSFEDSFTFKEAASWDKIHEVDGVGLVRCMTFSEIVCSGRQIKAIPVAKRINSRKVNEICTLRNWLYDRLRSDYRDYRNKS